MEVHFTPEQEAQLSQIASHAGTDTERLVKDAVLRLLEQDARFRAAVREGISQADRGEFIEDLLLILLVFTLLIINRAGSSPSGSDAKAFVNGKWFTGQDFESATFYAVGGILTRRKPSGPVETVDLQGEI